MPRPTARAWDNNCGAAVPFGPDLPSQGRSGPFVAEVDAQGESGPAHLVGRGPGEVGGRRADGQQGLVEARFAHDPEWMARMLPLQPEKQGEGQDQVPHALHLEDEDRLCGHHPYIASMVLSREVIRRS